MASDICKSATECTLQSAGILSIVGGVIWFVIAGLMVVSIKNPRTIRQAETFFIGTPPVEVPPEQPPVEQKEVTISQGADGSTTKTTTTTITNADGSMTVTQTTECIPAEND